MKTKIPVYLVSATSYKNTPTPQPMRSTMRNVLLALTAMMLLLSSAAQAAKIEAPDQPAKLTLELFLGGCLQHTADRTQWADKNQDFKRAEIKDPKALAELAKKLGYPANDRPQTMWTLANNTLMLYDLEHSGCMVTSSSFLD